MAAPHTRTVSSQRRRLVGLSAATLLLAACGDSKGPPVARLAGIEIETRNVLVEMADTAQLRARAFTNTGTTVQREPQWTCSHPELVVSCGPRFAARDTGTFTVVARMEAFSDSTTVRVYEEGMLDLVINEPFPFAPSQLVQGSRLLVKLEVRDSAGVPRDDRKTRWQSSDSSVAVVRDTTWFSSQRRWPGGSLSAVGPGTATLTVTIGGLPASFTVVVRPRLAACDTTRSLALDLPVGELRRYRGTDPDLPSCLQFRQERDAGRRYLVMLERLPLGSSVQSNGSRALFSEAGVRPADSLVVQMYTPQTSAAQLLAVRQEALQVGPDEHGHEWDVGGRRLRELAPETRPAVAEVLTTRAGGLRAQAAPASTRMLAPGDTLVIDALRTLASDAIWTGNGTRSNRAVVRYIGQNLVIADHIEVEGDQLRRSSGQRSRPIPQQAYAAIDSAYRAGKTQLDRLFGALPADRALGASGGSALIPGDREIIVNAILPRSVWGTAWGDLAIVDYWIDTDGTTAGVLQDPLVLANQLVTHELAHVRHARLQPALPQLAWSVEGIARFAEHLAFAATVLQTDRPSRTGNAVAGTAGYPTQPHLRFNREMPSAVGLETNFFGGYGGSAYVFDYIADQVEAAGGDGLQAVRDVLLAAASRSGADAVVSSLPGDAGAAGTFDELVTRARVALVLDDYATRAALPAWTQYLQFNVPASRPWFVNWPVVGPGAAFAVARMLGEGLVWGFVIDGDRGSADQDFLLELTRGDQAVLSIVRIQ